jgi:dolichyl-phosphate beta-glucosyltransferase
MYAFHMVVYLLSSSGVRRIKDTQCGFKLVSREAARQIFPYMHVEGWIFDIEMLHIASQKGVYMEEIKVNWHEVAGSKLNLAHASIQMALDLLVIRLNYLFGRWQLGDRD